MTALANSPTRTMVQPRVRRTAKARDNPARRVPLYFSAPIVAAIVLLYLIPIGLGFVLSFTSWGTYSNDIDWVGLRNFNFMVDDAGLRQGFSATLKFAAVFTIIANLSALGLALMLERSSVVSGFFRSIFFIPVLISPLATGYIFRAILDPTGPLNDLLSVITFWRDGDVSISWLGEPGLTLYVLAALQAWKSFGLYMLIYIAGLNSIPREVMESAQIEGAGSWQMIRRIKLPLIGPAVTFNVALALIGALQTFELIVATTQGGPGYSTAVLNLHVWRAFGTGSFGYAAAINVALFVLIAVLALPLVRTLRRREVEL